MAEAPEFVFPEPWADLRGHDQKDADERDALARELNAETSNGHELFGQPAAAVARCTACDHVLFAMADSRYAIVHLTWTTTPPDQPPWPSSTFYDAWSNAVDAVRAHEPGWE